MSFRSSDDLVILLRKLPERCKTRPSKLRCNSCFCPFVSKICRQMEVAFLYPNPKIYRGLGNICRRYLRYGAVPLLNVTTYLYIFFQIFCRVFQSVSNAQSRWYSIYAPITCIILATEQCRAGELDMCTRELLLNSRSATRTYLKFNHPSVYQG